jgi:hypothetical protein
MAGVVKPRTDSHVLPLCSQRKPDSPTEGECDQPSEGRPLARREDDAIPYSAAEVGVRRIGRGQLPVVEDVRAETAMTPVLLLARLRHSPSTSLQCACGNRPNRPRRSLEPPAARSRSRREVSYSFKANEGVPERRHQHASAPGAPAGRPPRRSERRIAARRAHTCACCVAVGRTGWSLATRVVGCVNCGASSPGAPGCDRSSRLVRAVPQSGAHASAR